MTDPPVGTCGTPRTSSAVNSVIRYCIFICFGAKSPNIFRFHTEGQRRRGLKDMSGLSTEESALFPNGPRKVGADCCA